jgi:aldehyde dehydrogenase (NAD+)
VSAFNFLVPFGHGMLRCTGVRRCGAVKPSSKVLLCAIAVHKIIAGVLAENKVPEGVVNLAATSSGIW